MPTALGTWDDSGPSPVRGRMPPKHSVGSPPSGVPLCSDCGGCCKAVVHPGANRTISGRQTPINSCLLQWEWGKAAHGGRQHSHRHPQEGPQPQVMNAPPTSQSIPSVLRVGHRPGDHQPQLFLLGVPRAVLGLPVEGDGQPLLVSARGTGAQLSHHVLQRGAALGRPWSSPKRASWGP